MYYFIIIIIIILILFYLVYEPFNNVPPWVILDIDNDTIGSIIKMIILRMNETFNISYYFLGYENVNKKYSNDKMEIICDFWIHDIINKITKRFITKFIINFSNKKIEVLYINNSNANYDDVSSYKEEDNYTNKIILTDENLKKNNKVSPNEKIKILYDDTTHKNIELNGNTIYLKTQSNINNNWLFGVANNPHKFNL